MTHVTYLSGQDDGIESSKEQIAEREEVSMFEDLLFWAGKCLEAVSLHSSSKVAERCNLARSYMCNFAFETVREQH